MPATVIGSDDIDLEKVLRSLRRLLRGNRVDLFDSLVAGHAEADVFGVLATKEIAHAIAKTNFRAEFGAVGPKQVGLQDSLQSGGPAVTIFSVKGHKDAVPGNPFGIVRGGRARLGVTIGQESIVVVVDGIQLEEMFERGKAQDVGLARQDEHPGNGRGNVGHAG